MQASRIERERTAYVAMPSGHCDRSDVLAIVDLSDDSESYGRLVHMIDLPGVGDGLGRYSVARPASGDYSEILVSGSASRIWPLGDGAAAAGLSGRPAAARAGSAGDAAIMISAPDLHGEGPAATVAVIDERDLVMRSLQPVTRPNLVAGFDMWASPAHGLLVSTEGCKATLLASGLRWESVGKGEYGHCIHILDLEGRSPAQTIDFGVDNQMVLRLVGASLPGADCYGFASVLINAKSFASSVWCWYRQHDRWAAKKVIEVPAEPCPRHLLPPALEPLGVVPPLLTDIQLSPRRPFLYLSCWGTGELLQYDVANPLQPRLTGTVRIGGIVQRLSHPQGRRLDGGPQSLRISNDGLRVYVTNSASGVLDGQFYPAKDEGWMLKFDSLPHGGLTLDEEFFVSFEDGLPQEILLSDRPIFAAP